MNRLSAFLLGIGLLCIATLAALWFFSIRVLPSYLAAWLLVISIPAGTLPILLGLELAGAANRPHAQSMRRILAILPLALLLTLPVLAGAGVLFHRSDETTWQQPVLFDIRAAIYLLVWSLLTILLRRPPAGAPRFALCALGLMAYGITATLAADDWIGALEPGPDLASLGLLFIASQATLAAAAARMLGAPPSPLMALLGLAWGFVAFTRFLTVWSADKPLEITYYQHRQTALGQATVWLDVAVIVLSLLSLLPGRLRQLSLLAAALVLLAHAADILWMVTPAARGQFTLTLPDIVAMLAISALAAGLVARHPMPGHPA